MSSVILGMIEDCVDRHGAERVDGGVEMKIQRLMDFIENDAIKSEKVTYNNSHSVLCIFGILVKAARMLDVPDRLAGVREIARELKDIVSDRLKPSECKLDIEHDEKALRRWLVFITYSGVLWMDDQFHHTSMILYIAQYGRESWINYDAAIF